MYDEIAVSDTTPLTERKLHTHIAWCSDSVMIGQLKKTSWRSLPTVMDRWLVRVGQSAAGNSGMANVGERVRPSGRKMRPRKEGSNGQLDWRSVCDGRQLLPSNCRAARQKPAQGSSGQGSSEQPYRSPSTYHRHIHHSAHRAAAACTARTAPYCACTLSRGVTTTSTYILTAPHTLTQSHIPNRQRTHPTTATTPHRHRPSSALSQRM